MNYGELKQLVKDYLEVDETTFNNNIATFVRLAEETVYRAVQLPKLRKTTTLSTADGVRTVDTPADFLSAYSIAVISSGEYSYLSQKEPNFLSEVYPTVSGEGTPRFYAVFDEDTLVLGPTPNAVYSLELNYFYKPASLSDGADGDSTWLSENAETALLFATVIHGYIFLKGDQDVIAMYQKSLEQSVADLKIIYEGRSKKDTHRKADARLPT